LPVIQRYIKPGKIDMNLSNYFVLMFVFAVVVFILVSREERKREREEGQRNSEGDARMDAGTEEKSRA